MEQAKNKWDAVDATLDQYGKGTLRREDALADLRAEGIDLQTANFFLDRREKDNPELFAAGRGR